MQTNIVTRTGEPPLVFAGKLLAAVSGYNASSKRATRTRWHELSLYSTAEGAYVARIAYVLNRAESFSTPLAWIKEDRDRDEIEGWFRFHRPADYVRVFPPRQKEPEREGMAVASVASEYFRLVDELLEKAKWNRPAPVEK